MPDATLPRVLTTVGCRRLGFTAARVRTELRRGRWRRLAPGVMLTRPDNPTRHDWMHVGMAIGGPQACVSAWDVVRLHGLGPARPPTDEVLVLTRDGHNRTIGNLHLRPSSRRSQWSSISIMDDELGGVRIASPARAIADTALDLRAATQVRAMVTAAIQRGLCTPAELGAELDAGPQRDSAFLRLAMEDVRRGAGSAPEAEAIGWLRTAGVTGFLANAPILDAAGRVLYRVDLLWPALRAVVEIDSREFHFSERDWHETMRRHNMLTALGYFVAHYPPGDIRERGLEWAREVDAWLRRLPPSHSIS